LINITDNAVKKEIAALSNHMVQSRTIKNKDGTYIIQYLHITSNKNPFNGDVRIIANQASLGPHKEANATSDILINGMGFSFKNLDSTVTFANFIQEPLPKSWETSPILPILQERMNNFISSDLPKIPNNYVLDLTQLDIVGRKFSGVSSDLLSYQKGPRSLITEISPIERKFIPNILANPTKKNLLEMASLVKKEIGQKNAIVAHQGYYVGQIKTINNIEKKISDQDF
jgi:hypothetical protein